MYSRVLEADEDIESDVEDIESDIEADEAARPTRPSFARYTPGRTGGQSYYTPRTGQNVSQQQLQAALAKIRQDVQKTSSNVTAVNKRVNTTQATVKSQGAALGKVQKYAEGVKKEVQNFSSTSLLLPLLLMPKALAATGNDVLDSDGNVAIPKGTAVDISTGKNNMLLLMLLLGGTSLFGGSSSSNGSTGSGGMDQMTMLLLVLAMSGGLS